MNSKSLIQHKIVNFHKIKISAKIWKAQIVLPCRIKNNEMDKKSVLTISKVLN